MENIIIKEKHYFEYCNKIASQIVNNKDINEQQEILDLINERVSYIRHMKILKLKEQLRKLEALEKKHDNPQCVGISLFNEALRLIRDLAELQNGAPLVTYEADWNKTMSEIWSFLEANESPNIRQNEEQVRNCETCKYSETPKSRYPCNVCICFDMWKAITIVPTEGHSD